MIEDSETIEKLISAQIKAFEFIDKYGSEEYHKVNKTVIRKFKKKSRQPVKGVCWESIIDRREEDMMLVDQYWKNQQKERKDAEARRDHCLESANSDRRG